MPQWCSWCTAMWLLASPFLVAHLCSVSLVLRFLPFSPILEASYIGETSRNLNTRVVGSFLHVGETGKNLNTRLTEHKWANNHIAVHHQLTNHDIDWVSAQCSTYSTNYFHWLTLESLYTNLEQMPLNRCQQLPAPYKRLIHDQNKTDKLTSNRPTKQHRPKNQPIWLTIDRSKPTNDWWPTLHKSFSQYHHG